MQEIDYKRAWEELKKLLQPGNNAPLQFREYVLTKMKELEQPSRILTDEEKEEILSPTEIIINKCSHAQECIQLYARVDMPTRKERLRRLIAAAAEKVNGGWGSKNTELGWSIVYDTYSKKLTIVQSTCHRLLAIYFKSQEAAQRVLDKLRPELEELLGIKEGE